MRKSRFGEEQIIHVLGQVEADQRVKEVSREHEISQGDLPPLEGEVGRAGRERGAAAA